MGAFDSSVPLPLVGRGQGGGRAVSRLRRRSSPNCYPLPDPPPRGREPAGIRGAQNLTPRRAARPCGPSPRRAPYPRRRRPRAGRTTPSARSAPPASRPGARAPCPTACAALRSRSRAMMMALSVETRFSLRAVLDRPHAFLHRGILHREALDAAVGAAGLLGGAVHQVIVVAIGDRLERAGNEFRVHAGALAHRSSSSSVSGRTGWNVMVQAMQLWSSIGTQA